jgi:hypothetical protein
MKPTRCIGWAFVFNAFLFWTLARIAGAYLEPGRKSFFLKILVASLVGMALVFRRVWKTMLLLFSKPDSEKQKQDSTDG